MMWQVGIVHRLLGSMHTIPHVINLLLFVAVYSIKLVAWISLKKIGRKMVSEDGKEECRVSSVLGLCWGGVVGVVALYLWTVKY